jgi:hypothetical protein
MVRGMDTLPRVKSAGLRGLTHRTLDRLDQTPRRLIAAGVLLGTLAGALVGVLIAGTGAARGGLSSMAASTDEVGATNDLYFRLNDMDAQAADALLLGFHPTVEVPASVDAAASVRTYESDRDAADRDLQKIAANVALADPYARLLDALGGYEALISQALYIDQGQKSQSPAKPPAEALSAYQSASSMMHSSVLPIASAITATDSARVDDQYAADRGDARIYALLALVAGLLLLAALAAVNWYLARRFRRILAPALAAAALVTLVVAVTGTVALWHVAVQFKIAKQDAFDSINALTRARAVSYDANADESRWLLDPTAALQNGFFAKASQIAAVPGVDAAGTTADPGAYYDGLKSAVSQLQVNSGANSVVHVRVGGFLGTELNNVTFPDEAQGAVTTVRDFEAYVQDDAVIRADANRGDLSGAVAVDIGTRPGESNYAYYQYDQALTHIIAINEDAFQAAIADGQGVLEVWAWLPYVTGAAVLLLVGAGLYPRLREYR